MCERLKICEVADYWGDPNTIYCGENASKVFGDSLQDVEGRRASLDAFAVGYGSYQVSDSGRMIFHLKDRVPPQKRSRGFWRKESMWAADSEGVGEDNKIVGNPHFYGHFGDTEGSVAVWVRRPVSFH